MTEDFGFVASPPIPRLPKTEPSERVTQDEAQAMARAVLNLFERWELKPEQRLDLLGGLSERTLQRWRSGQFGVIPRDTIYRMGDLLGIHKALRYMFVDINQGYGWVKRPNDTFGGKSALDVMLQGAPSDISRVRALLDAERGGW